MKINLKSLSYIYNFQTPHQVKALDRVSFSINPGEVIGVIGPSGSGKSCLLRCIAGILIPSDGAIEIVANHSRKIKIGLIIQEPEQQFFLESVFEEVAFTLKNQGINETEIKARVNQALAEVGFGGDIEQSPFRLSGGEQRRVAIASILATKPDLLLLDEPTVGLDVSGISMISATIRRLREEQKSVVIVSHDLDFLYQEVDRYLLLEWGIIKAEFPKNGLLKEIELLERTGVGAPELVKLANTVVPGLAEELLGVK